jgi:hypothetical protein
MYNIQIEYALNGLVVRVGCQTVVFESIDGFLQELNQYLREPRKTEVRWRKNQMFSTLSEDAPPTLSVGVAPPPPPPPLSENIPVQSSFGLNDYGTGGSAQSR